MIIKEEIGINSIGKKLYRTYSDEGLYIRQIQTGIIYDEAIDIENAPYTYVETNELIENASNSELEAN